MTYRERLQKDYPEFVHNMYRGGCKCCPETYGYEAKKYCECVSHISCEDCWNREIPKVSHEEEVRAIICKGNLEDLEFSDLQDVMKDPARYKLTFGQVVRICEALRMVAEANNKAIALTTPATTDYQKKVNAELRKKNRELESRLEAVEKKLDRMSEALEEDED